MLCGAVPDGPGPPTRGAGELVNPGAGAVPLAVGVDVGAVPVAVPVGVMKLGRPK